MQTPDHNASSTVIACKDWSPLHPQVCLPGVVFLTTMAVLSAQRAVLAWGLYDRFADASVRELAKAFVVGLRFDAVIAAMMAAVPLALLAPVGKRLFYSRRFQIGIAGICAFILSVMMFLTIADYYFFREFDARLNQVALNYLGYDATYAMIWQAAPVIPALVATISVFPGLIWLLRRIGFCRDPAAFAPVPTIVWTITLALAFVMAIRGSIENKPINSSPAYFSKSMPVAQLTLNGVFTLREAIFSKMVRKNTVNDLFKTLPPETAIEQVRQAVRGSGESFVDDPKSPLLRIVPTGRPRHQYNVVLVIVESLSWHYVGQLGGQPGLTPNFDALAEHGVLFDRCFAVGTRTSAGIAGIVGGFPDLPGGSVTTRIESEGRIMTIAESLRRRGYETMFLQGGQPMYDHHKAFLKSNGVLHTYNENEFESNIFRTPLGWSDEDLYHEALKRFDTVKDQPFFSILLTLSTHNPYDIPAGRVEPPANASNHTKFLTSIRYADWAIGQFMKAARTKEYFENTIFVFTADHTGASKSSHPIDWGGYRIPLLIYAPAILGEEGRRVSAVCSQTDIAPTILDLLGGTYENPFFGSNAMDRSIGEGSALMQRNNTLALLNGNECLIVVPPYQAQPTPLRFEPPDRFESIDARKSFSEDVITNKSQQAIAMLQVAESIYNQKAYRLSAPVINSPGLAH